MREITVNPSIYKQYSILHLYAFLNSSVNEITLILLHKRYPSIIIYSKNIKIITHSLYLILI
jgi:hypothetical protein